MLVSEYPGILLMVSEYERHNGFIIYDDEIQ